MGELYLVWAGRLHPYVIAIENILGEPGLVTVTKDIIEILKATQYSITDRECFESPPRDERDVHHRVEAVLRCVFPNNVLHKPSITKSIKNFEPDTGLPSIRTLIEYKFVSSSEQAKKIADEMLADSRGFHSKDWDYYVYLIYETNRVKSEAEWNALMRESGMTESTRVVVISGEPPTTRRPKENTLQKVNLD